MDIIWPSSVPPDPSLIWLLCKVRWEMGTVVLKEETTQAVSEKGNSIESFLSECGVLIDTGIADKTSPKNNI